MRTAAAEHYRAVQMVKTLTQRLEQEQKKLLDFQVRWDAGRSFNAGRNNQTACSRTVMTLPAGLQEKYKIRVKNEAAPADSLQPSRGTQGVLTEKPA